MKYFRNWFYLFFIVLFISYVNELLLAQTGEGIIKGIIRDAQMNEPIPGANILLLSSKLGTNSYFNGDYIIKGVPEGDYLISARFVGYKTENQKITIKNGVTLTINFILKPSAIQMDEIIITGQGASIEKRKLASPVESLSLKEIEKTQANTLDGLLQGRITGLRANFSSGMPGGGARLQTRGIKSAFISTTPVIYIDGIRIDNNDNYRLAEIAGGQVTSSLSELITGDIEKIEVIKGGAASTLYGSEAANGVIQVFTKRGLSGIERSVKWKASLVSGFDFPELKWTKEQLTKDRFYQNGFFQGYKLNVIGGTEMLSYNISGLMNNNTGIVIGNRLSDKTYNFFGGIRAAFGEKSDLQMSAIYTRHDFKSIYNDNVLCAPLGNFEYSRTFQIENTDNPDSLINIYMKPSITETVNRFTYSTNISFQPYNFLSNKFIIGLDYRKSEQRALAPKETGNIVNQPGGFIHRNDREYLSLTIAYTGSIILPAFGPINQVLSIGGQGFRVEDREFSGVGNNFTVPGTDLISNTAVQLSNESNQQLFSGGFFVSDQLSLYDNIFIDIGIRFDGNSSFGNDIGLQTYPKAGIAYNISDEEYFPAAFRSIIGNLKLRSSWGQTGNFPPPYTKDKTFRTDTYFSAAGLNFDNPGDKNLRPEKTSSVDIGFDAGLFDDQLALEFSYYYQNTKDALFSVLTPVVDGLGYQEKNVGEIENSGIEFSIKYNIIKKQNIDFEVRASINTISNKVISLGGAAGFNIGGFSFAPKRIEEGYPIGVWSVNIPRKEADGTYNGTYDTKLTGNPTPKYNGSFWFDLVLFKNLSINLLGEYAFGGDIQDVFTISRLLTGYQDAKNLLPISSDPNKPYNFISASSLFIENSDWIKIREINLRYHIEAFMPNGINLFLNFRNPFVFAVKALVDPEQNWSRSSRGLEVGGLGGDVISPPKQFRLGIEIPF